MHCPSNCFCFIQPCSIDIARLHVCKWCKHYKFSLLVMQLQLCDQSVQTCLTCCCFAEAVWSALLDWHSWLMDCGSDEGGFLFLFFLRVCSHALPWSRLMFALTQFPIVCIPLCRNSILSLPALVSHMKQRTVCNMCVTLTIICS